MERYQEELTHIKELLKENPRGMTVTEIAKAIRSNRNSVAKYLDVLLISGQVDMKTVGSAKIFFLSQRTPISALLDFSSDHILVLNRELKILQVNENLLEFLNFERDVLLGQKLDDVALPMFTCSKISKHIQNALDGKGSSLETNILREEEEVYFKLKFLPTTFDDGTPGVTIILENITDQKRAEAALREERDKLQEYLNVAKTIFIALDTHRKVTMTNKNACKVLGYTEEEIIGQDFDQFIPEHTRAAARAQFFSVMSGASHIFALPLESPILTKSGEERFLLLQNIVLRDEFGHVIGMLSSGEDITERKQAEAALQEERDKVHQYLAVAKTIFIALDVNRKVTMINPKGCEVFGYTEEELVGKDVGLLIPGFWRAEAEDQFFRVLAGELHLFDLSIETPMVTKHGEELIISWNNAILRDQSGAIIGTLSSGEDVTERKQMRETLKIKDRVIEASINGIVLTTPEGDISYVNQSFLTMWGYNDMKEVLGKSAKTFLQLEEKGEDVLAALQERGSWTGELIAIKKDGNVFKTQLSVSIVKDDAGKPVCIMASFIKLTQNR